MKAYQKKKKDLREFQSTRVLLIDGGSYERHIDIFNHKELREALSSQRLTKQVPLSYEKLYSANNWDEVRGLKIQM